jgi:hypothetical protein
MNAYVGRFIVVAGTDWHDQLTMQKALLSIYAVNQHAVMMTPGNKGGEQMAARLWSAMGCRVEERKPKFRGGGDAATAFEARDKEMLALGAEVMLTFNTGTEGSKGVTYLVTRAQQYNIEILEYVQGNIA